LTAIEAYLIDTEKTWIHENIITVHKYALNTTAPLSRILGYCNQILVSQSDDVFKSNDFAKLPKEALITLLKSDELTMDEDDIWASVIQWAIKQVPELELESNSDDWSSSD